ncbi:13906_t:CDS:2 [Funneliformis geosporum]|uniref:13906_t:CDS:1 n=1 Tax=Funneliformis geosporum TaxID=1117311 RepID=A0A9W4SQG0_9GLOM|nr:13906_t:CDS:2 [Funneliformis geosporum]
MATSPEVLTLFENLNKRHLELENNVTRLKNVIVLPIQQGLAAEIREGVKEFGKWIEVGISFIIPLTSIIFELRRNEDQFKQLQSSIRRAILASKQNIEKEAKIEREMLLGRGDGRNLEAFEMRRRNLSSEDAILHSASDVTESLRRTTQLMQQEIERSAYSAKVLDESSRTLKTTFNEYRGFSSVVRSSKQLITKLEQKCGIQDLGGYLGSLRGLYKDNSLNNYKNFIN